MSKQRITLALHAVFVLLIFCPSSAKAQGPEGGWSEPYRLSSEAGKASEATLVADEYGYVHAFWREILFENQQTIIQYARFDGGTWSAPNDIYLTPHGIEDMSAVVDQHGTLHLIWTEGYFGPVYYSYAPASTALSAQSWAPPLRVDIPAGIVRFQVDSKGVFHILYINRTDELGVYYVRSEDQGETWSEPLWLDPDILPDHTPDSLNFELDDKGGLHAVWFYGALERGGRADWVRYSHSLDGGKTWSVPFMIDQYFEDSEHNLTVASPVMAVQGQNVHIIWAAGELPYRYHRYSTDAGMTWSAPTQVFGELHGQAFDGLTVDAAGRVHFFGQIRYPFGIYHAYWDQTRWSKPSLVYLIADEGSEESFGNRIHAHHIRPFAQVGNQLVVTFADPPADPNRRLFVVNSAMSDIPLLETIPTPTSVATQVPSPSPSPSQTTLTPMATSSVYDVTSAPPVENVPSADSALRLAVVPVLLLLGGTFAYRWWNKHKS